MERGDGLETPRSISGPEACTQPEGLSMCMVLHRARIGWLNEGVGLEIMLQPGSGLRTVRLEVLHLAKRTSALTPFCHLLSNGGTSNTGPFILIMLRREPDSRYKARPIRNRRLDRSRWNGRGVSRPRLQTWARRCH